MCLEQLEKESERGRERDAVAYSLGGEQKARTHLSLFSFTELNAWLKC